MQDLQTPLVTPRLCLRPYEPGDAGWYHAMSLRNRSHLAHYEAGNAAMTIETVTDAENVLRDFAVGWAERRYFFMGAFLRETDEFVAQIYIGTVNRALPEFELGYFADLEHEGLGYVTEAAQAAIRFIFEQLGAHRIRLGCNDTNVRSYRVAERCGMVREGHFREDERNLDGSISGSYCYGMLRSEYRAAKAGAVDL